MRLNIKEKSLHRNSNKTESSNQMGPVMTATEPLKAHDGSLSSAKNTTSVDVMFNNLELQLCGKVYVSDSVDVEQQDFKLFLIFSFSE